MLKRVDERAESAAKLASKLNVSPAVLSLLEERLRIDYTKKTREFEEMTMRDAKRIIQQKDRECAARVDRMLSYQGLSPGRRQEIESEVRRDCREALLTFPTNKTEAALGKDFEEAVAHREKLMAADYGRKLQRLVAEKELSISREFEQKQSLMLAAIAEDKAEIAREKAALNVKAKQINESMFKLHREMTTKEERYLKIIDELKDAVKELSLQISRGCPNCGWTSTSPPEPSMLVKISKILKQDQPQESNTFNHQRGASENPSHHEPKSHIGNSISKYNTQPTGHMSIMDYTLTPGPLDDRGNINTE
jgi:hypothetical protein